MENKNKSNTYLGSKKSLPTNQVPPEWQVELKKKELKNIARKQTELMEWTEAKKTI